jgi:trehalose 6-phosphate synthase
LRNVTADLKLILCSAWWGESFVTELRRISQTADRKVHFGKVSTSKPDADAPLKEQDNVPTKDKESDPAVAVEAQQDNAAAAGEELPERPKTS